ncbi:MAG: hypothetical protein Q7T21_07800 [Gallionella sp.]|nr:hypothetical protein [Gallionella sp.]
MTVITLDLDSKMLDMAEQLGIKLPETVGRLLLIEVNKRLQERKNPSPQAVKHP